MRKEILIAIIIGVGIGLTIAFGVWRANSAITEIEPQNSTEESREEPAEQETINGELKVVISGPEENDVFTQSPILVSGLTKPNTLVVISGESEDAIITSQPNGGFEAELELEAGINKLIVKAFSDKGESAQSSKIIVYSSEFGNN